MWSAEIASIWTSNVNKWRAARDKDDKLAERVYRHILLSIVKRYGRPARGWKTFINDLETMEEQDQ